MTEDGYPEEHELQKIKEWDLNDVFGLIEFISARWNWSTMAVKKYWSVNFFKNPVLKLELHTVGWSGNEDIIEALLENIMVKYLWYEKWIRGGHFYFEINPYSIGYLTVIEFAKKCGVSKQAIHKYKDKYEWLDCGNKKLLVREKKDRPVLNMEQEAKVCDATEAEQRTET